MPDDCFARGVKKKNVYILSSEHTHRPMRARVVAQLFYNSKQLYPTVRF